MSAPGGHDPKTTPATAAGSFARRPWQFNHETLVSIHYLAVAGPDGVMADAGPATMTDRELIRELIKRLDLKLVEKPVGKVIAIDEYTECTGIVRLGVGIVSWDTNGMRVLRQTKARVR